MQFAMSVSDVDVTLFGFKSEVQSDLKSDVRL